ncbi:MAG: putative rane protein [Herbinix sp.]|nr:putative rane protein [Herbinix sp.]
MKKNILTIIIMAITLINTVLLAVLIFAIVPTANKTMKLIDQVNTIVDLELESPEGAEADVSVSDIVAYSIADKLTLNLKSDDGENHYAILKVSLSMNSLNEDYETLNLKVAENENAIKEIISDEFGKYTKDEVKINANKNLIKEQIIVRIQEYFKSDFIINVSFGDLITQ